MVEKKPSDIHRKKDHKLTRRRVIRMLTAAGVAPAAASRITVDDVKAADDDQVPISLDTKGNYKVNVSADWYDRIVHTRDVSAKVRQNHGHRNSVIGIGYSAGEWGGDNPYVTVAINENSDSKEKDKKKIPDERDGVRVEKREHEKPTVNNCPNTSYYENLCDNYDCDPFPKGSEIPAGPIVDFPYVSGGNWGSHTSQTLWTDSVLHLGWMTSAHLMEETCEANGQLAFHQPATDGGDGYKIGEVVAVHPDYDVAIIEATGGYNYDTDPSPYVHESSNLQGGNTYGPIEATMSKDAVNMWEADNSKVFRYSGGTCYDYGRVEGTYVNDGVQGLTCGDLIKETIHIQGDGAANGDSGGLHWGYYGPQDVYLGMGVHSASYDYLLQDFAIASAGYRIDNDLGYYWSQ